MTINNAWNIGWWNQNANRNYPISEEVSRLDSTGSILLPNDFIVDLSWTYTNDLDASYFHILSVTKSSSSLTVVLGYDNVVAGTCVIDVNAFTTNSVYLIIGTGDHYDSVGTIVIGSLGTILDVIVDVANFPAENTKVEATTVHQLNRGISNISVLDNDLLLTGDVTINVGNNLRIDQTTLGDVTYLKFNAVSTEGLVADCVNCDESTEAKTQIISINGITPDINGNIQILGDNCLQVSFIPNGIHFDELCSQPCCGCEELAVIKNDFKFVRDAIDSVNTISSKLSGELTALSLNLISSQTEDIATEVGQMVDFMQALLDDALSKTDCNQPC